MLLGDDADDVILPPRGLNRNLQQTNANTIPNNTNNVKAFHAGGTGGPPEHDSMNKIQKVYPASDLKAIEIMKPSSCFVILSYKTVLSA